MKRAFFGGVHPKGYKELSREAAIVPLHPSVVSVAMSQHIGAPCQPLVKVGDRVTVGQKIGDGQGLCVPVHASVSGTVTAIEARPHPGGNLQTAIVIESDGRDTLCPTVKPRDPEAAAVFTELTGVTVIPGMAPLEGGVQTVAGIGFVLAGAFPLVFLLTKLLRRPLAALGRLLGMNGTAAAGLVASLANSIPMFGMVKDMDERGKIVNIAFAVPAAFVFGDHLGFTAGYDAAMLGPVIAAKLTGGVLAVLAALLFTRKKPAQSM